MPSLIAHLGLNDREFNSKLGRAQNSIRSFSKGLQTIGLGLGAAGVLGFFRSVADEATRVDDFARLTGLTREELQELTDAFERNNVKVRASQIGLQRFTRRIAEARIGQGELKDTLEAYGIALTDADGRIRSTREILGDYANAIQNAGNEQEQLRLAFKAFDTEGAALVRTLADGEAGLQKYAEQARAAGRVISEDNVQAITRFSENIRNLVQTARSAGGNLLGFGLTAAEAIGSLAGGAVFGIESMVAAARDLPPPIREASAGMENLKNETDDVATSANAAAREVQALAAASKALENARFRIEVGDQLPEDRVETLLARATEIRRQALNAGLDSAEGKQFIREAEALEDQALTIKAQIEDRRRLLREREREAALSLRPARERQQILEEEETQLRRQIDLFEQGSSLQLDARERLLENLEKQKRLETEIEQIQSRERDLLAEQAAAVSGIADSRRSRQSISISQLANGEYGNNRATRDARRALDLEDRARRILTRGNSNAQERADRLFGRAQDIREDLPNLNPTDSDPEKAFRAALADTNRELENIRTTIEEL